MSDRTYQLIWGICYPAYWVSARPTILHAERAARLGGYLLAANHHSPYDVPGLMATTPRNLDFLSIVEFRDKPLVGPLFRAMNCTFLDRRRRDPAAVRQVHARLRAGRVVALFPEGGIRKPEASVTAGGPFNPGVVRLAHLSGCPIVPTVILNTGVYSRFTSYLPLRAARFGVIYGLPISAADPPAALAELRSAYVALRDELAAAMRP
jgi:1-acyl-sn-glycerol-3-phosphate acyltransferase